MVINFLGDSITEGVGASCPEHRFSSLVCKRLEAEEINLGHGGTRIARQRNITLELDEDYFLTRAVTMSADVDFTFVFGGTNDYGHGDVPLGNFGDKGGYTFYGAFEELVAYMASKFPKDKLCFIMPLPRYDQDNVYGDGRKAVPVAPLAAYIAIEKEVLNRYGVQYLDLSKYFPVPQTQEETEFFADGLHPNDNGYRLLGEKIVVFLSQIIKR